MKNEIWGGRMGMENIIVPSLFFPLNGMVWVVFQFLTPCKMFLFSYNVVIESCCYLLPLYSVIL